ncbi:retinal cone rhodopsin-sensitive cGMP 3, 5 -cyclic phosphodiesterase subunit gamma-like protein [Labeo rohita]|uniref:3',5'-cyclic-GMP phosphodiesterase n=2 Tax=Labeo rohita TaxID=84645 RepID=A0A498NL47_LABRO|nr:retinal cone rhodopsin-sensitive cGMP 3, 5 -cyclic phosphodiesterase subunit gamma-like protein [Labeo rohita]
MSAIKAAGRRTGHELKARSSEEQKRREPAEEPETQAHVAEMDAPAPAEKRGPPKFKQRTTRTFKSKAPKPGQKGFGDEIPGMEGLGTDITVICPWEAFGDMELSDLAKYGIV